MGFGGMIRTSAVLNRWHVYGFMCSCDIRRIVGVHCGPKVADLGWKAQFGRNSEGSGCRRWVGAGEIRKPAALGWHRTCRGMCDCDVRLPMAVLRR